MRGGRSRAVASAVVLLAAAVVALTAGAGGSAASARRVTAGTPASVRRALIAKLDAQQAHFTWVVCVRSGARYRGAAVVRCNVDFGDPHIQAYCSVFRGGRLLTNAEDPAIPCRHDGAGYSQTIKTYH